jgi:Zn-dependent M28 family amino/carboxypeptidase
VDTVAIEALARELASDGMRGRGPYTRENEAAARLLAGRLRELGAVPVLGGDLLVPFTADSSRGVVYNVVGMLPARSGGVSGEVVGITAHFDHLGVGRADSNGDTIYNGFLDAAVPVAMLMDVARRYAARPGERALLVMFFNLEEQGLQGARALVARSDFAPLLPRISFLIGMDAGSPAGEALEYQLMGTMPSHAGAVLADSLARARGWSTTATPPRAISDVFVFSQRGVPIIFPIPGRIWKGYSTEQRDQAMARFDHYHQPSDEWHPEFPWTGTAAFADWIWTVVREASTGR